MTLGGDLARMKEVANKELKLMLFADSLARPVLQESDDALSLHNKKLRLYPNIV